VQRRLVGERPGDGGLAGLVAGVMRRPSNQADQPLFSTPWTRIS
jgi:hypothetical protein